MSFGTAENTRVTITSAGNIAIGTITATDVLQVEGSAAVARFVGNRADALGPRLSLAKSRSADSGSSTIVQDGDEIGQIMFKGADGNDADSTGAAIVGLVNGTPGANDMPGALTFLTTSDGNNSPSERVRVTSGGDVGIGTITPKGSHAVTASNEAVLAVGIVTAREYYGDGSNLTGVIAGVGIRSDSTTIGFGVTFIDFIGSGIGTVTTDTNSGIATINVTGGSGSGGGGGSGVTETDTTVSTVNPTGVGSFATASFRSASVIAQINQLNTDFQVGRYLMIHDGTTVTVVEESAVSTGSTMLGSFTGVIDGSNVELRVTLASAGVSTVTTKIDTVTV